MLPTMKKIAAAALASAAIVLSIAACGSSMPIDKAKDNGMTDSQALACDDFARGFKEVSADDTQGKVELARKVNKYAQQSGDVLKEAGDVLARSATGSAQAWQMGGDYFAGRCIELGWPTSEG